jgi:hypothetical protein
LNIDEFKFEDFACTEVEDEIRPTSLVNHKKHGYLVVVEKKDGKYLCCGKDEPEPARKELARPYEVHEIT